MDEEGIDRLASLLVRRKTFVDQLALVTSYLRGAVRVHKLGLHDRVGIIFNCRGKIPDRRKAQSRDRRVLAFVGELVRHARLETALYSEPVRVKRHLPVLQLSKLPVFARDQVRRGHPALAHRQAIRRIFGIERRVGIRVVFGRVFVRFRALVGNEPRADPSGDRLAVVGRDWGLQADEILPFRNFELPADGHDCVAFAHQQAVAKIRFVRRIA